MKFVIVFLKITHPEKKKCIREYIKPFMTQTYSGAITQIKGFRNQFLKNPTEENKLLYKA